jgi:putative transposase
MLSEVRARRGERGIWQRRFWEHLIRDERDFQAHMDYVHINPVKHGLVGCVADWPYSTFHRLVARGVYPVDWAGGCEESSGYDDNKYPVQCAMLSVWVAAKQPGTHGLPLAGILHPTT